MQTSNGGFCVVFDKDLWTTPPSSRFHQMQRTYQRFALQARLG
jgi:hypothetical protein